VKYSVYDIKSMLRILESVIVLFKECIMQWVF